MVDGGEDLRVGQDAGVVLLPTREPIGLNIDLAGAMHCDGEDLCLITHGPEVLSNAV